MAADAATLSIRVDNGQIVGTTGALRDLTAAGGKAEGAFGKLKGAAASLGLALGAGAIFSKFVKETIDSQNAQAQLEARIKSTGMAAGLSAKQLDEMSLALARQTTYGDEAIKGAQALLLTFTKIKGDTFPQATLAVANLATAMGTDLKGAALQVGKALQDPEQGLLALRRSGVSFSETQQEVIKNLFATGQQAEAQRLILKELEVEFGGAAAAARDTLGGALIALKEEWGNLFEISRSSSSGVVGAINAITRALPALDTKLQAVFGGFRLMWVDLQVAIQKFNAAFYDTIGSIAGGAAKILSFLPGTSDEVRELTAASDAMHLKAGILRDSFEAWRTEQEALITGTGQAANVLGAAQQATDDYTKSAYEQALADARAAKAKQELNEQIEKQLDREFRLQQIKAGNKAYGPQMTGFATGYVAPSLPTTAVTGGTSPFDASAPTAEAKAKWARYLQDITHAYQNANKDMAAIRDNFLRGMQESFAKTFADIFTRGVKSFGDLFARLGDLIKQAAAQMAASGIMKFLTGKYGEGSAKGGGILGGIGAIAGAIPGVGWIAGAVAGIAGLFQSHHKAAEAAKRQSEENRRLTIEHQKAADAAAAQSAKEAEKARVELQFAEDRYSADLRVRQLRVSGFTAEADALELWNRQVSDFADAVKRGFSDELLSQLSKQQEYERLALAANQAAEAERKLAEQTAEWARQAEAIADLVSGAWSRTADTLALFADRGEDLSVRMLKATGQMAEAERRAFEIQQKREMRAVDTEIAGYRRDYQQSVAQVVAASPHGFNQWGEPYLDTFQAKAINALRVAMEQQIAAAAAYKAELQQVQSAEAGAFTTGQSMPGASAAIPGTAGSFNTVVSHATAAQGDRMLDELTTTRTLQQAYLPYLKVIADKLTGGVNRLLGAELLSTHSLAGSAVVS